MDINLAKSLCWIGSYFALFLAGIGSTFGSGIACSAAIGAWKRCYEQNKPAAFQLVIFASSPISQIIYGMIIMFMINDKIELIAQKVIFLWPILLFIGITSGIALGISSWAQGVIGASCCNSFGENNKGFVNLLMMIGIIETISIFIMAFAIVLILAI